MTDDMNPIQNAMDALEKLGDFSGYTAEELAFGVWFSAVSTYCIFRTNAISAGLAGLGGLANAEIPAATQAAGEAVPL